MASLPGNANCWLATSLPILCISFMVACACFLIRLRVLQSLYLVPRTCTIKLYSYWSTTGTPKPKTTSNILVPPTSHHSYRTDTVGILQYSSTVVVSRVTHRPPPDLPPTTSQPHHPRDRISQIFRARGSKVRLTQLAYNNCTYWAYTTGNTLDPICYRQIHSTPYSIVSSRSPLFH